MPIRRSAFLLVILNGWDVKFGLCDLSQHPLTTRLSLELDEIWRRLRICCIQDASYAAQSKSAAIKRLNTARIFGEGGGVRAFFHPCANLDLVGLYDRSKL